MNRPVDAEDEEAWAKARSALERLPPEPPDRRAERLRRQRRSWVLAVVLVATAAALLLLVVVLDGGVRERDDVPGWRVAAGFAFLMTGFVLMLVAVAGHSRAVRHLRGWQKPLDWLTRGERRQLLRQARGRAPLDREQLPLVRHVARVHEVGIGSPAQSAALVLAWTGHPVVSPHPVPFTLVLLMTVGVAAGMAYQRWNSARLQRFLDEHPEPTP